MWLFREKGMLRERDKDPSRLRLAVAGVLGNGGIVYYEEKDVKLLAEHLFESDLIVGYNVKRFDYGVLSAYLEQKVVNDLRGKTFDMFADLHLRTRGQWIKLEELCVLNLGMKKSLDTLEVPKLWREGKKKEVMEYLRNDLLMTKGIYEFGKANKRLRYLHKNFDSLKWENVAEGEKEVEVEW